MHAISRSSVLCAAVLFAVFLSSRNATAEELGNVQPIALDNVTPEKEVKTQGQTECDDLYFPRKEVISATLPVTALVMRKNDRWAVGPAVGVNFFGGKTIIGPRTDRYQCKEKRTNEGGIEKVSYFLPKEMAANYVLYTASADFVVLNPSGGDETSKEDAEGGLLLGAKVGYFYESKWTSGGHNNSILIGGIVVFGYLFPSTEGNGEWSFGIGPAIQFKM